MSSRTYQGVRQWTHENQTQFTKLAAKDPMFPTPDTKQPRIDAESIPKVKYAVIGAGLTGCSVAHTMLNHEFFNNDSTMVLEAREVASGATATAYCQVAPVTAMDWGELVRTVGARNANQVAVFSHRNLARLRELVGSLSPEDQEEVQFRRVTMVTNFTTPDARALYRRWDPAFRKMFKRLGIQFAAENAGYAGTAYRFRIRSTWGVVKGPGATLKPAALVSSLFRKMLNEHHGRFSIQTHTAVEKVEYSTDDKEFPYILHTSRGSVRASSVIHCCNGWTAHLDIGLRGKLFPLNRPMSVQALVPNPPDESSVYSWRLIQRPTVDYHTGTFIPGQYSIVQNGASQQYFVAGGPLTVASLLPMSREDALELSKNDHRERIHRLFRQPVERLQDWVDLGTSSADDPCDGSYRAVAIWLWSRCVGYTADLLPLVRVIPVRNTYTRSNRQWIAAGCNGRGLDKCWLMGEALVAMIAGEFVENRLPDCYPISYPRLNTIHAQGFLDRLLQIDTYGDTTPIDAYLAAN